MKILRALPARIKRHNAVVTAAGIAFYGLLALVPTLLATVSIYGLVNEGNEDEIKQQIEDAAGSLDENTQGFIEGILEEIVTSDGNTFALLFGLGLALFSASGAVQKLMGSIAVAYDAIETRPGLKLRLLAYLFTMAAIIGVVLMALVLGVIPALLAAVDLGGPAEAAIRIGQLPLFTLLFVGGLTVLYRYAPDRQPRTPWLNPGAWVAAALWLVFAILFSVYSAYIGAMPASYGLLGTVAALMIFLQLTSIAIIIGAEVNAEREDLIADDQAERPPSAEAAVKPLSLTQAAAGLAVLFVLGRGSGGGN
ncbi:MAG: YihY/virulence factor BrkB family protein [Actinomycetia bacterium]|nr:YihY/virulence factor BrkB family protein [Actinomycetes bacterium]